MRYLAVALLLLFFAGCRLHPKDCSRFRDGTFQSTLRGHPYFIERKGAVQKEYVLGTPDSAVMFFNVEWLNDYTYTLKPTPETLTKFPKEPKNAMMTIEIIRTTPKSYVERTTTNFSDRSEVEEFTKVN